METEPELVMSPLCQPYERDGEVVQVDIYGTDPNKWILEVVDQFGNSTVWDDPFPTDRAALDELKKTVEEDGIKSLIGPPSGKGE